MKLDEALECADEWTKGQAFHEGSKGWRMVCCVLAAEVLRSQAYKEAVQAAQRLLDGEDEDDLHQATGLPTEECKRLLALINAVDIGSR